MPDILKMQIYKQENQTLQILEEDIGKCLQNFRRSKIFFLNALTIKEKIRQITFNLNLLSFKKHGKLQKDIFTYTIKNTINPRPPYLPPEKPVFRTRSNSQYWTWNNRLVPNWEKGCQGCILSPAYLTYTQSTSGKWRTG